MKLWKKNEKRKKISVSLADQCSAVFTSWSLSAVCCSDVQQEWTKTSKISRLKTLKCPVELHHSQLMNHQEGVLSYYGHILPVVDTQVLIRATAALAALCRSYEIHLSGIWHNNAASGSFMKWEWGESYVSTNKAHFTPSSAFNGRHKSKRWRLRPSTNIQRLMGSVGE